MAGQRITDADLANRFTYHPPTPEQTESYVTLRNKGLEFATLIRDLVPAGRQASLAVTAVEEAVMRANAAIAQDTSGEHRPSPIYRDDIQPEGVASDLFDAPPPGGDVYPPAGVGG